MASPSRWLIVLCICLSMARCTRAQSPFASCLGGSGNIFNATLVVPLESLPTLDGFPLAFGSEVAVFSSDPAYPDLCVGRFAWQGAHGVIVVWGDDDLTLQRDGMMPGETLWYRVWDRASGLTYEGVADEVRYALGDGLYHDDGLMVLDALPLAAQDQGIGTAVEGGDLPEEAELHANYPNPVTDVTNIAFVLPQQAHVTISVFDLLGRHVMTLLSEAMAAGRHEIQWRVQDVPSGVYLCRMQAGDAILRHEVTIVR